MIYPSTNGFGIPDLSQVYSDGCPEIVEPFTIWGSVARAKTMPGTYAFYTDDERFTPLWDNPDALLKTACQAVVEPNFSVLPETPMAVAIWRTYQKRWLARHWQRQGITVWVDLFVGEGHQGINLEGVPKGWQRWATRASERGATEELTDTAELVLSHSAGNPSTLIVYGGGAKVREWCSTAGSHGLLAVHHIPNRTAGQARPGEGTRRKQRLSGGAT